MPAYLYKNKKNNLCIQVSKISLAGRNVIFSQWSKKGKPINNGWHISIKDIITDVGKSDNDWNNYSIIIDAAPSVKKLVDLVEVQEIYVYTYGDDSTKNAYWSNLMLIVKDILWKEDVSEAEKQSLTKQFKRPPNLGDDIFTFLYMHGEQRGWVFGRLGQMNGAWIHKSARQFFRSIFNR